MSSTLHDAVSKAVSDITRTASGELGERLASVEVIVKYHPGNQIRGSWDAGSDDSHT